MEMNWIEAKNGSMPPENEYVLATVVTEITNKIGVCCDVIMKNGEWFMLANKCVGGVMPIIGGTVTHWMPLPKPAIPECPLTFERP